MGNKKSKVVNSTARKVKLSPKEYQVADLLYRGFRNITIAKEMGLNQKTISTNVRRLYQKCNLSTEFNIHMLLIKLREKGLYEDKIPKN